MLCITVSWTSELSGTGDLDSCLDRGKSAHQQQYLLSVDLTPLKGLLEATLNAFVTTTHARLANISPRQYTEFVEFLGRARDTFSLHRPDGPRQFKELLGTLCHSYRGKRKLVTLLNERFHCEYFALFSFCLDGFTSRLCFPIDL